MADARRRGSDLLRLDPGDELSTELRLHVFCPNGCISALDDNGRVIYLGSLTKGLLPGIRLGFIVAAPELIHELRVLRRYQYRHPPANNQRILALFLAMGHYDAHLRRLRDSLARFMAAARRSISSMAG